MGGDVRGSKDSRCFFRILKVRTMHSVSRIHFITKLVICTSREASCQRPSLELIMIEGLQYFMGQCSLSACHSAMRTGNVGLRIHRQ